MKRVKVRSHVRRTKKGFLTRVRSYLRSLPKDAIIIKRRGKYIDGEVIIPRSHTVIFLNKRGKSALKKVIRDAESERKLALDLTGGGGYDESKGVIYIMHSGKPVYLSWRKIQKLLNKVR